MFGVAEDGEVVEGVDGGQPGVTCRDRHSSNRFEMVEERADERCVEVGEIKLGWWSGGGLGHETEKQTERVAVGVDGVGAGIALRHEPFGEERFEGRGQRGHDGAPKVDSARRAAAASSSGTADRYQYVEVGLTWPR